MLASDGKVRCTQLTLDGLTFYDAFDNLHQFILVEKFLGLSVTIRNLLQILYSVAVQFTLSSGNCKNLIVQIS